MCECLHVSSSCDQLLLNTSADNAALISEESLQSVCSSLNGLFQCCLSASVYLSFSVFVTSVFSIISSFKFQVLFVTYTTIQRLYNQQ